MNTAFKLISGQIQKKGPISFEKFMEMALYGDGVGYYERPRAIGRAGDFFTSVSVGRVFGQLLAGRFGMWAEEAGVDRIVEAGAHDGQSAADILQHLPAGKFRYTIVEPSQIREEIQRERLKGLEVEWVKSLEDLGKVNGIIFSNELLDAFPVKRMGWNAEGQHWFEWGVDFEGGEFVWRKLGGGASFDFPSELLPHLPDGFVFEISPQAERWWKQAAGCLGKGKLVAFDYGFSFEELLQRPAGTLRAYKQHRFVENILGDPGEQDITAHVNFTRMQKAGEEAGLSTEIFETQGQFLTRSLAGMRLPQWSEKERSHFLTLTHPAQLGSRFRALVQSRTN